MTHRPRLSSTRLLASIALVSSAMVLGACSTTPKNLADEAPLESHVTLSEGYALLHGLMGQESRVAGIFLLKSAPDDFKGLIGEIARTAEQAGEAIEGIVKASPELSLDGANLPQIEADARAAIEGEKTKELLGSSGVEFQRRLTVEQIKATNYAAHLARSLAARETNADRARYLDDLASRFDDLTKRLFTMLSALPGEVMVPTG
jgi:hypothetical protein